LPWWVCLLGLGVLLVWQGWLTQQLFGGAPWENLQSDQPIVSGTHPQNLYLGLLGARALTTQGRISIYDENFQAGYPKTPIFDGGRLAELFLVIGGQQFAAYKIGIALVCLLVPLLLWMASKTLGLGNATALLATFLGQIIWWGPHGRNALEAGDSELYLASLAALAHVGLLIAFHRTPSVWAWFGLWITGCLGWFLQPLLFPIALPMLLVYYLSVGVKHEFLTWHVAFWTAETIAFLLNLPWLVDWVDSWWLRASLPAPASLLPHRTLDTLWNAPLWAGSTERLLAMFLISGAGLGILVLNQSRERPAARLLLLGTGGSMALALLGISWEPLGAVGTSALLAPALWFACLAAAQGWVWTTHKLWRFGMFGRIFAAFVLCNGVAGFILFTDTPGHLWQRCVRTDPLAIGLGPDRQAIVDLLGQYTTTDARILWEDRTRPRRASRWSALLPLLTGRQFIGGLDPDGFIEHSSISLINQSLETRPIAVWTDEELAEYCRRYNIRWVVAWSPVVIQRFEDCKAAEKWRPIADEGTGWLFQVKRTPNFALKGQADFLHSDGQFITLGNVVPHHGEVTVSLHFQAGMRASPGRVQVERAISGDDPIGFVRLRLAVPAPRVTLTWER
jgi:hypothetical protein